MILDTLDHARRYASVHPGLSAGFEFLLSREARQLSAGRHAIDGERLFAIVAQDQGRGRERSPLEHHERFLDIQYVVSGEDLIGWRPRSACSRVSEPYDAERDIAFFFDRPDTWLAVPAGAFAIFFPDDAHAPLAGAGPVHKIVVKVALDWR